MLTKNSNNTWDAISEITLQQGTSLTVLDDAFKKGLPIIGMDATPYKSSAVKGALWDGTSFSGGNTDVNAPADDDEFWNITKRYVFLCENLVVLAYTSGNDSPKAPMFEAAFAGETILIKTLTGPRVKVGKTFNWNGTELTLI
jgi:hypothetical protein